MIKISVLKMKLKVNKRIKLIINKIVSYTYKYKCSVCGFRIKRYIPLPSIYKENSQKYGFQYFGQNEHLNIEKYSCPNCGCTDRDRLYASYFSHFLNISKNSSQKLLHVAPAWSLNNLFLMKYFKVITTDLMMPGVDFILDVEKMDSFQDKSFDFIICSHVLEHVNNPDAALKELYRVLKPNGKAILMAPINLNIKTTIEDSNHKTKEERIKYYGQDDHLRLFAKNDFIERIENAGFSLNMIDKSAFGKKEFKILGLRNSSVLYIGKKIS